MFAAYFALAWWAQEFAVTQDGRLSVWYPPPGLVLVVLHLRGLRYWPVAVLGELVVSIAIYDVADDFGAFRTVVNAVGITGAYAIGAAIVRAGLVRPALARRYDLAWLVLATFLVAAPLAAAIGVGVQQWAGFELDGGFLKAMGTWWMGDAIGLLVIAPVGYALARTAGTGPHWLHRALGRVGIFEVFEAAAVVAMPIAVFMVLDDPYRALYLLLLPVVLVAVRHGAGPGAWAVLASVLTATVAANETEGGTIGRTDLQLLLLVLGMSGNAIGVLERLRRSATGRARELAALFEASPDLVAIVDDHNRVQWVNPAGRALLERTGVDAVALAHQGVVDEDATEVALQRGSWTGTVQMEVGESPVLLSQMVVRLPDEHGRRVGVVARDVTDLHDLTDQLRRLAFTDELTGLANRARLIERLGFALASTDPGAKQSLVLIDIDRFSRLNDHRGHDVGDAVLQGVADRLRSVVRSGEMLARVGDDRFAVLVENVHDEFAAVSVAERLRAAAGGSWVADLGGSTGGGAVTELSVSAGVVLGGHGDDPDVMLRQADLALQRSKAAGGARSSAYDESLSRLLVDRVRIEVLLREALAGPGWPVRYQPVVDLRSGEVLGCEALLEPLAPPLEVVAVAEELGLIGSLSEHVLRAALDQAVVWRQRKPGFKVGVNVSALQLGDPVLPGRVNQELTRAGLPGDALVLEVTETAFTEDAPLASRAAKVLRDMGVQVSIDDFGTGFSSLSRLRSLPVDEIKLDRTFVADLGRLDGAESIIAAVVAMSAALDLKLVAEGVEEEHQRQALVDLGCAVGQGWLFAYPMAPQTFDAWLDSHLAPNVR
jgi:diguanylate cyclase (GGDEF)-like protein